MHWCCTHLVVKGDACQKHDSTLKSQGNKDQVMSAVLSMHQCSNTKFNSCLVTGAYTALEGVQLMKEYLDLAEQYPTPMRMIRGHTFSLIGQYYRLPYDSMLAFSRCTGK